MTNMFEAPTTERIHLRVTGIVQGVGFRPFVYKLANNLGLTGFVGNDSEGVFIEIEGASDVLSAFVMALENEPPPLAHIESISPTHIEVQQTSQFVIVASKNQSGSHTLVSPDLCICDDCLTELLDPNNRRYRYPFINCTNCGPRLTIIQDLPYDRPKTTLSAFPMCPECKEEYHDPGNRRFHAQPNACQVCGPQVWYQSGKRCIETDAIAYAQSEMADGNVIAVKGLGGFHLACDASNNDAVRMLRERKQRPSKPFAVMMRDLEMVRQYAELNTEDASLLSSRERPIVLLRKKENTDLSTLTAPGNHYIGVMLPYTPLHYLLLAEAPLVMTSANISGEPLVKDNSEAIARISALADGFLMHDRDIEIRCDDSVVRVLNGKELPVRRSRGYAPFPVQLPFDAAPILAVGGELKATFCITRDRHAILSQHIGDMENLETMQAFEQAVEHYLKLFQVEPEIIVADAHPGYLSTRWAQHYADDHNVPLVQVQHHHAHIASVMAENGIQPEQQVIGICFDGTGYGLDGTIWGGEVLLTDYQRFERVASLKPIPLAGGDAAVKRPYRVALAHLWAAGLDWDEALACVQAGSAQEQRILQKQFETNLNTIPTSSMGRLFDAVASLVGVRQEVTYEAQAAIELEALIDPSAETTPYRFGLVVDSNMLMIDPTPVLSSIIDDLRNNVSRALISAYFHEAVAEVIVQVSQQVSQITGITTVALSGGVFQNVRLLKSCMRRFASEPFDLLYHQQVPANDGGLALGQAAIGAFIEAKGA